MKPKLKPCPFCGSTKISIQKWDIGNSYFIMCHNCPARMDDTVEDRQGNYNPITLKSAIKIWNTRKMYNNHKKLARGSLAGKS